MKTNEKGLIITGKKGSGKTTLSRSIASTYPAKNVLHSLANDGQLRIAQYAKLDLIIVDGVANRNEIDKIYNLVPPPHRSKLILVTQMSMEDLKKIPWLNNNFTFRVVTKKTA